MSRIVSAIALPLVIVALVIVALGLPGNASAQTGEDFWVNEQFFDDWFNNPDPERPLIARVPGNSAPTLSVTITLEIGGDMDAGMVSGAQGDVETIAVTLATDTAGVYDHDASASGTLRGLTITVKKFFNSLGNPIAGQFIVLVTGDESANAELGSAQFGFSPFDFFAFHLWPFFTFPPEGGSTFPDDQQSRNPGGLIGLIWFDLFFPSGEILIAKDVSNPADLDAIDPTDRPVFDFDGQNLDPARVDLILPLDFLDAGPSYDIETFEWVGLPPDSYAVSEDLTDLPPIVVPVVKLVPGPSGLPRGRGGAV